MSFAAPSVFILKQLRHYHSFSLSLSARLPRSPRQPPIFSDRTSPPTSHLLFSATRSDAASPATTLSLRRRKRCSGYLDTFSNTPFQMPLNENALKYTSHKP